MIEIKVMLEPHTYYFSEKEYTEEEAREEAFEYCRLQVENSKVQIYHIAPGQVMGLCPYKNKNCSNCIP